MSSNNEYWNSYYGQTSGVVAIAPSQFAAFLMGELSSNSSVVDIGCGSGRDALFFAQQGFKVLGIDASDVAIDGCNKRRDDLQLSGKVSFRRSDVEASTLREMIDETFPAQPVSIYARFFLHAIDEEAELSLIRLAAKVLHGDALFAVEFRTHRDAMLKKETPGHYRRYIEPSSLVSRLTAHGLEVVYFVEGFGYAKYKNDDAHVARIICRKADIGRVE